MKKQGNKTGQVILETAIVLISVAALAISSMVLFSNLNRNMVSRLDKYRDSRIAAVNNPFNNNIAPESFLNYSPYIDIITQSVEQGGIYIPGTDPLSGFDLEFYEDPRIAQAELLLIQADDIINNIIPFKIGTIFYDDLDGATGSLRRDSGGQLTDTYDYNYIYNHISLAEATHARNLCNELLQDMGNYSRYTELSAPRAYDNIYEDMNGIDSDGDGFLGAIGLLQQALDVPMENGPFDPDLGCAAGDTACLNRQAGNISNRSQLQSSINAIKPTQSGIDALFFGSGPEPGMIGRLTTARNELNSAVNCWNCYVLRMRGFLRFYRYYTRPDQIGRAVSALLIVAESISEAESQPTSDDLANQIKKAYELLQPPVDFDETVEARNILYLLSLDPETRTPTPILYNIIRDTYYYLNQAIGGWTDPVRRQQYLDLAREKLEVLYDIITST